jgi:hypothetical protein
MSRRARRHEAAIKRRNILDEFFNAVRKASENFVACSDKVAADVTEDDINGIYDVASREIDRIIRQASPQEKSVYEDAFHTFNSNTSEIAMFIGRAIFEALQKKYARTPVPA